MLEDVLYSRRGQIMLPFVFFIFFLFLVMNMLVELLNISRERVNLQRAADAGALAMATFQARALNSVTDKNFILKYPSGDRTVVANTPPQAGDPLPGINTVSEDKYTFSSRSVFEYYMKVMGLHQTMQEQFVDLYGKLVPKIAIDYITRNLSEEGKENIQAPALYSETFDFQRIPMSVKYVDWDADASGSTLSDSIMVPSYMIGGNRLYRTAVDLEQKYSFFGQDLTLKASASAEVIPKGRVWSDCANSDPVEDDISPVYDARMINR